jgi:hypothetical protein
VRPAASGSQPDVLVAVQVDDEKKARTGLARLATDTADKPGVAFTHGYALIAQHQSVADRAVVDDGRATLAKNSQFEADQQLLGESGVASGWMDLNRLSALAATASPGSAAIAPQSGRIAFALRFNGTAFEAIFKVVGSPTAQVAPSPAGSIRDLPASTALAVEVTGADAAIRQAWTSLHSKSSPLGGLASGSPLDSILGEIDKQYGISLPVDLETLVGSDLVISADANGLTDNPKVAIRSKTNGPAALAVWQKIRAAAVGSGADFPLEFERTSDGVIAGTDRAYLSQLTSTGAARLGSQKQFTDAVPDAATASTVMFIDLDAVAKAMKASGATAEDLKSIQTFQSVGLTVARTGVNATVRLRLVEH